MDGKNVSQKHRFLFFFFFFLVVIIVTIKISYCYFYCCRGFFKSGIETDRVELQWNKQSIKQIFLFWPSKALTKLRFCLVSEFQDAFA